jgi:CheY-like chemotaxis protein
MIAARSDGRLLAVPTERQGAHPSPLILVVDDDPTIRGVLVEFVGEELQLRVSDAADGAEALARIAHAPPSLVLLDLMMPIVDGFETCRRIKADPATRGIPVVAVSAGRNRDDAMAAGCDDFLAKPFALAQVEATLHRWLVAG